MFPFVSPLGVVQLHVGIFLHFGADAKFTINIMSRPEPYELPNVYASHGNAARLNLEKNIHRFLHVSQENVWLQLIYPAGINWQVHWGWGCCKCSCEKPHSLCDGLLEGCDRHQTFPCMYTSVIVRVTACHINTIFLPWGLEKIKPWHTLSYPPPAHAVLAAVWKPVPFQFVLDAGWLSKSAGLNSFSVLHYTWV